MRQFQITPKSHLLSSALHHNLGILTSVEYLSKFDMIYIYHHIQPGCLLKLERDVSNPFEPNNIIVSFKGFKLGYVSQKSANIVGRLMDNGSQVEASVKCISRNKYMPLDGLDIEIKALVN